MAGGVASSLAAASRRGGRALTGRARAVRGRRVLARAGRRGAGPARAAARRTCSATSSTATASWRSSPSAGPTSSRRTPARPRSCSTPTTRWSPTSAATARAAVLRRRRRHARDRRAAARRGLKHCRRCGHPYAYEAIYLAHLGPLRLPELRRRRPEPEVVARDVELHGIRSAAFTLATPAGQRARGAARCPASTTSTTRSAPRRSASRSARRSTRSPRGSEAVAPAFGRAETVDLGGRPTSILLVKNPAGANEVLRTLALEGEELDLFGVLNDNTADGRDISWVWDADWELLAGSVRQMTCSGTRAAELGAAVEVRRRGGRAAQRRAPTRPPASTRRWRAATARSTRCRPTRRCSSCATCWRGAARCRGTGDELLPARRLARRRVRPLQRPTSTCGTSWRRARPARSWTSGAGTGRVALALARAGHDVTALDREPELLAALAARGGRRGLAVARPRSPTPATSPSTAASG